MAIFVMEGGYVYWGGGMIFDTRSFGFVQGVRLLGIGTHFLKKIWQGVRLLGWVRFRHCILVYYERNFLLQGLRKDSGALPFKICPL